jgi:hypothetical protein
VRSVVVLIIVSLVATGCLGENGSARRDRTHGGYSGEAAHYYDASYRMCRKLMLNSSGKEPDLLSIMTAAPARYEKAAQSGCAAGEASVTYPGTSTP